MLMELIAAVTCKTPFPLAWKRARHIRYGHPFDRSTFIEKKRFEKHPQNSRFMIYTVNLRRCDDCGLIYEDAGFEGTFREG